MPPPGTPEIQTGRAETTGTGLRTGGGKPPASFQMEQRDVGGVQQEHPYNQAALFMLFHKTRREEVQR